MARRKDGRELVEVFKELTRTPSSEPPVSRSVPPTGPAPKKQGFSPEDAAVGARRPVHTIRLGERRQIEILLSNGWAYGISIFVMLALAGVFAAGRRFAPPVPPQETVAAPDAFSEEAGQVGEVRQNDATDFAALAGRGADDSSDASQAGVSSVPAASQPTAAPDVPTPLGATVSVTDAKMYTVRVISYKNRTPESPEVADALQFLKDKGLPDVRTYNDGAYLVIVVGRFATTSDPAAQRVLQQIKTAQYKGKSPFDTAYFSTLKGLQ